MRTWEAAFGSMAGCPKEEPSASVAPVLRGGPLLQLTPLLNVFPSVLSFLYLAPGPRSTVTIILSQLPYHSSLSLAQ